MLRALERVRDRRPQDPAAVPPARCCGTEAWLEGSTCRELVEDPEWLKSTAAPPTEPAGDPEDEEEKLERSYAVEVSGRRFDVKVIGPPPVANGAAPASGAAGMPSGPTRKPRRRDRGGSLVRAAAAAAEDLVSPLQGTILRVAVEQGAEVEEGALICVIEAMKMENEITAHRAGKVEELGVSEGGSISTGAKIAVIK